MRITLAICALAAMLAGCDGDHECDAPTVIVEDTTPDVVYIVEEDTTPDVIYQTIYVTEEDTTPDVVRETVYVTEEDTTPDVVREYYSDAADLPVLTWEDTGGAPTMPKKYSDLPVATSTGMADLAAISQGGTSKQITLNNFRAAYPPEHIHGLETSNDAGDIDHDIEIAVGGCRDSTDVDNMELATVITKQIDAVWAVGDNAGGLDGGAVAADTGYAVWLIKRSDTLVVDVLFSLSFTAPAMPTDYDRKQLIGGLRTDNVSDLYQFEQRGNYFALIEDSNGNNWPREVLDAALPSVTWTTGTMEGCPPNCLAEIGVQLINATSASPADGRVMIRPKFGASWAANQVGAAINVETAASNFREDQARCTVLVDGSKQMEYAAVITTGAESFRIYLIGWWMLTRARP